MTIMNDTLEQRGINSLLIEPISDTAYEYCGYTIDPNDENLLHSEDEVKQLMLTKHE